MSYREKTPQVVSILTRKLKPGKTFEDFQKAHTPPGEPKVHALGTDVEYFSLPTRVINIVSTDDPRVIVSIGLSYGEPQEIFAEVQSKIPLEQQRAKRIAEVADKVEPSKVFFVASDNNYGGIGTDYQQLPLAEVTPEVTSAIEALMPKK